MDAMPAEAYEPAVTFTGEPMLLPLVGLQTRTPVDVVEQTGFGDEALETKNSLMLGALDAAPGKLLIPSALIISRSVL